MKNKITALYIIIFIFLLFVLGIIITYKVEWKKCKICGVQQYERFIYGVLIPQLSEYDFDEFGAVKRYKQHHNNKCNHVFTNF